MSKQSENSKEGGSVAQSSGGFTVSPGPLNTVKLELALVLIVAVTLYAVIEVILDTGWLQVSILAAYGLVSFAWLVARARKIIGEVRGSGTDTQQ